MVWDETAMAATRESELMRESLAAGAIRHVPDLPTLARAMDLDPGTVEDAVRPLPGRRGLTGPYHLAWLTHGVLTTQGGAVVDPQGRVVRADGSTVAGLRAGGGTAVGLAGADPKGYSSGNGLLAAFGMGWIIGNDLAGAARR